MYYPYFRGKQFELKSVRECADILTDAGFVPIIEPVSKLGIESAIDSINKRKGELILIVNPKYGNIVEITSCVESLLNNKYAKDDNISAGILLREGMSVSQIISLCSQYSTKPITFIHAGFAEGRLLATHLGKKQFRHVYLNDKGGKLYQKNFLASQQIILKDAFKKRKNREHPTSEYFSELHVTYTTELMNGFGDFLIVGDDYSEGGGRPYCVAIHLTYIDRTKDDQMHIHHFKSDRYDTPEDTPGKFAEALDKLVREVQNPKTQVMNTSAVKEFVSLHSRAHFPGLGYIKKLSMNHHIETLADYLK